MTRAQPAAGSAVHHVELWTEDLATSGPALDWLLTELGWQARHDPAWPQGRTWHHPDGTYLVLEASPAVTGPLDRMRAGLNHLALRVADRSSLDRVRGGCGDHGWTELFADSYPHAGGPGHTALFLENDEGLELELVTG